MTPALSDPLFCLLLALGAGVALAMITTRVERGINR